MNDWYPRARASVCGMASVLLLALAGHVGGQEAQPSDPKPQLPHVEKDVAYAAGGDEHKLDLYLPARPGFATVVFTYGGGWHTGGRKSVTPVGEKHRAGVAHESLPG